MPSWCSPGFPSGKPSESVVRANALNAQQRGHQLLYTPQESLPLIVGDRSRLEQVMMNVIGNAIKYTPDGGHIRITGRLHREYGLDGRVR